MSLTIDNYRLKPNHVLIKKVRPKRNSAIVLVDGQDDERVMTGETPIAEVLVMGLIQKTEGDEEWLPVAPGGKYLMHALQGKHFPVRFDGMKTECYIFHRSAVVAEVVGHDEWEDFTPQEVLNGQ